MAFFNQAYLDFMSELARNNNKEWFDVNRKTYEKEVKEPFKNFVGHMIGLVQQIDPSIQVEAKHCLFRINRDIRFSKDKTPYKTHMAAAISRGGRKEMGIPGLYFHMSQENLAIYGGCYNPDKTQLADIRYSIANDIEGFRKAINDTEFVKYWGELKGDKNKVLPKDLKEPAAQEPYIFNKAFYYGVDLPVKNILREDLDQYILSYYQASEAVRVYLTKAIGEWNI